MTSSNGRRTNKPWFNDEIKNERKERKRLNVEQRKIQIEYINGNASKNEWKIAYGKYDKQQKRVKRLIKRVRGVNEKMIVDSMRAKGEEGSKNWHRFLRGEQCNHFKVDELCVDGETIGDKEKMKKVIAKFWEEIGGIEENLEQCAINLNLPSVNMNDMDMKIGKKEIETYLRKLKNEKANGPDMIPYEMYKYGGEIVVDKLYDLFGKIWDEEKVPDAWNSCNVTLLHKGGHKSKRELKNYRPIALGNTVGKIFSGIMNERMKELIELNRVIGEEQNGFRKNRRGEDNIFVVNEVINNLNRNKYRGYIAFIDIEKAYDRVDREILWKVLEKVGFSRKIVNIIKSMYVNTEATYILGDIETKPVCSMRGVRQGCAMSPILFALYTEELAVRLRNSGLGVRIDCERLSSLLYADDITILSETCGGLEKMLEILDGYGKEFNVKFSKDKSKVLVLNGGVGDIGRTWMIGNVEIARVSEYKYLGCKINERGCELEKTEKLFKANQWFGRLSSVARFRANKYECIRGLWKFVGVPGIMYGMNVMNWTETDVAKLEVIQTKIGRVALGGNKYVGVEAVRGDMGWSMFNERLSKAIIMYKVRIERMDDERWVKRVHAWNIRKSKWEKECFRRAKNLRCQRAWNFQFRNITLGGWWLIDERGDGRDWSENDWKKWVNERVKEIGLLRWKEGMAAKPTLEWYMEKPKPRHELFYCGDFASQLLFRARTQSLEVNARTYRWSENGSKECKCCDLSVDENVEHIILDCPRYACERENLESNIREELGLEEWMNLRDDRSLYISRILGLDRNEIRCNYINCVKEYLENVWKIRTQTMNSVE